MTDYREADHARRLDALNGFYGVLTVHSDGAGDETVRRAVAYSIGALGDMGASDRADGAWVIVHGILDAAYGTPLRREGKHPAVVEAAAALMEDI